MALLAQTLILLPLVAMALSHDIDTVLRTELAVNTGCCGTAILLSLRCGVWAGRHRLRVIEKERAFSEHSLTPNLGTATLKRHVPSHSVSALSEHGDVDIDGNRVSLDHFLSFPFCFHSFFEFLSPSNSAELSFIVELAQFKERIFCELENVDHDLEAPDFAFLPNGGCFAERQHGDDVVFAAWNLFAKYIGHRHHRRGRRGMSISKEEALRIGTALESLYQRHHFLFSQRKYLSKHRALRKMKENISKLCRFMPDSNRSKGSGRGPRRSHFHFNDYFGTDSVTLYRSNAVRSPNALESELSSETDTVPMDRGDRPLSGPQNGRGKMQRNDYRSVPNDLDIDLDDDDSASSKGLSPLTLDDEQSFSLQRNDTLFEIDDLWALIDGQSASKIPVPMDDLKLLSTVFDAAECAVWRTLKEQFAAYQAQSDEYLLCRRKLRRNHKVNVQSPTESDWNYSQIPQ